MTFTPEHGLWAEETFDGTGSISGATSLQGVTGGYVTLLPQRDFSATFFQTWVPVSGWSISNSMNTEALVEADFEVTGRVMTPNAASGFQKIARGAAAWEIFTHPLVTGLSGQSLEYLALHENSPSTIFYDGLFPSVSPLTIEFDVASIHSLDNSPLPGYTGNLSGLPALSGVVNHGLYLSDGVNWDFIEARPDGLRSFNHPELSLRADLTQPKSFRLGLDGTSMFLLDADGKGVAGVSQFDTPVFAEGADKPILALGAPFTGWRFSFASGVTGLHSSVGHSFWDNINIFTGNMVLGTLTGVDTSIYSTSTQTVYTKAFKPSVGIGAWDTAVVDYEYYPGGTTTITPQYRFSGDAFTDSTAVVLDGANSVKAIPLSTIPVFNIDPETTVLSDTIQYVTFNAIRFKIDQSSTRGSSPAPIVDSISVRALQDKPYLELIPNWKPAHQSASIVLGVKTGTFLSNRGGTDSYTTAYLRAPSSTGVYTSGTREISSQTGSITAVGTGEIVFGPISSAFQTYNLGTGSAATGTIPSDAYNILGGGSLSNYVPDPMFNLPFRPVTDLPQYETGFLFGEVGQHVGVPPSFQTGSSALTLNKLQVHRPGSTTPDFAQKVLVHGDPGNIYSHGIQVTIPSGILSGDTECLFSCDLKINKGSGVVFFASGAIESPETKLHASSFSGFGRVSLPVTVTGSSSGLIYITAETGYATPTEYVVDNLSLQPFTSAYYTVTGVLTKDHKVGSPGVTAFSAQGIDLPPKRSCTNVGMRLYLDSYPTGQNVLFQKIRDNGVNDNKGLTISINTNGYPEATFDTHHMSWYTGFSSPVSYNGGIPTGEEFIQSHIVTGLSRVPLGRWHHLGFAHQVLNFRRHGSMSYVGQLILANIAACNRAMFTIDGQPVQNEDMMRNWTVKTGHIGPDGVLGVTAAPYASFIPDGTGTVTVGSGLFCKFDDVHLGRPPVSEVESRFYMNESRTAAPYFIPDVHLKPGHQHQSALSALSRDPLSSTNSPSVYTQNVYTLYNPGPHTNWDHGYDKNHLLFFNDVTKTDGLSPYSGSGTFGSTRFHSGGYGKAGYSSSFDRFSNYTGNFSGALIRPTYPLARGGIFAGGWVYLRETGAFFELAYDETDPGGIALIMEASPTGFNFGRRLKNGDVKFAVHTGWSESAMLNSWINLGIYYRFGGFTGDGDVGGSVTSILQGYVSGVAQASTAQVINGADAGFDYAGRSGDPVSSALYLGRDADCNLTDVFLGTDHLGSEITLMRDLIASTSGDKEGIAQEVYVGDKFVTRSLSLPHLLPASFEGLPTGYVASYAGFNFVTLNMPTGDTPNTTSIWAEVNDATIDEIPHVAGFALHAPYPFITADAYHFKYDDEPLTQAFGATDSPIRVSTTVPEHAINIARIDSPTYTVNGAVSTIDLSDDNPDNLSTFRGGKFTIEANTVHTGNTTSGSFKNINSSRYENQADIVFSGSVDSNSIRLTSLAVAGENLQDPGEAFYAYLIGRGEWGVKIPDASPHNATGVILATGEDSANTFMGNMEKIKDTISIRGSNGKNSPGFVWDAVTSPYTPDDLVAAVQNKQEIPIDGVGTGSYTGALPDGVFSVILISPFLPTDGETVWIHYPGYRFDDNFEDLARKEIYNPIPIMRERLLFEEKVAGQFDLTVNSDSKDYDVRIYGVDPAYSGKF